MFTLFNSQFKEILIIYVNNNALDFSIFGCTSWHAESTSQVLNAQPLPWKHGVLTTGQPGPWI